MVIGCSTRNPNRLPYGDKIATNSVPNCPHGCDNGIKGMLYWWQKWKLRVMCWILSTGIPSISTFFYVIYFITETWQLKKNSFPDSLEATVLDASCVLPIRHAWMRFESTWSRDHLLAAGEINYRNECFEGVLAVRVGLLRVWEWSWWQQQWLPDLLL